MPKIQQYELGKTLGTGAFSKVKYATDTNTGQAYAIKIVSRDLVKKQQMEEQLKKEIAIMKILKHPHVIELTEVLQTQKHIYIVLELVTGGELFDRIVKAKRFQEDVARRYFQQLMDENGIAHRDLKPENLLLDANDCMKISDFGLSALTDDGGGQKKTLMTTCGTPNYVAPEVIEEQGYDGFKADIWSSGVILFVMLAGYLPFEHDTMQGLFNIIKQGKVEYPKWFSPGAKNLISKMLVVDPKKRITLEEVCQDPWFTKGGFTRRKTEKIDFSGQDSTTSISEAKEEVSTGGTEKKGPSIDPTKPLNAFELASYLMVGSMNPLFSASAKIHRETQFLALGDFDAVSKHMEEAIKGIGAKSGSIQKSGNEMKAAVMKGGSMLTFRVEFTPIRGKFCHVEVSRGKGDILDYNQMYNSLIGKLDDIIVKSK